MGGVGSCRECGTQPRWGTADLWNGLCARCYARTPQGKALIRYLDRIEREKNARCHRAWRG